MSNIKPDIQFISAMNLNRNPTAKRERAPDYLSLRRNMQEMLTAERASLFNSREDLEDNNQF